MIFGIPRRSHKHVFIERQLPSGLWVSEEHCPLRLAAAALAAELDKARAASAKVREEERAACEKAGLN